VVIWQLSAADTSVAHAPSTWLAALAGLHRRGELFPAVIGTLTVYLVALVVAVVVGSSLGMAIGASRRADGPSPLLDLIATLPGAAMVPVSMLLVGINLMANAATVALAVVWPVLLNATAAMRTIPAVRLDVRTLGLSALDRWRKIICRR
jgi:ABC-type nitrate/sulfonate/bicarbonate transport system permease component